MSRKPRPYYLLARVRSTAAIFLPMLALSANATVLYNSGIASQTPPQSALGFSGGSVAANSFRLATDATLS